MTFPIAFGSRAEDETRTRDPDLGKVVLYQLSYFRLFFQFFLSPFAYCGANIGSAFLIVKVFKGFFL